MSFKDKETKRKSLLSGVSIMAAAAAALTATPAHAQDEEEAIVVTGSRIPQANLVTTSPVTQVTGEDITTQGVTRVEDLTNQLPQVFAAQGSNVSNGATGTAQVNLRGIGAARTLVLIDGRRMGYGSPNSTPSDLNQIPGGLVERVEVLTGGASAVYGSDAIAGVVNFIMRDDFEGFRFDAQYGFFQHSNDYDDSGYLREELAFRAATNPAQFEIPATDQEDGYGKEVTITFGTSTGDGRGNVTAYVGYRSNDAVLQRDRDYSACALGAPSTAARPYSFSGQHWTCGGSGTAFPGTFTDFGGNSNAITFFDPDGLDGIPGNADDPSAGDLAAAFAARIVQTESTSFNFTVDQGTGEFIPFNNALHQYNFGPINYYQRPDERYSGGFFARYEINDRIEAYGNFMFSDYRSVAQIAPSGDFFNVASINCDNPLLTPEQQLLVCGDGTFGYTLDAGGNPTPDLGDDDAIGGVNSPGADGIFGNDPDTAVNEALDDEYNTDAESPCADTDPGTPGMQCDALLYIGRRNVEGGGRQDDLNFTSYRATFGLRGPLSDTWDYDVYGQYYRVALQRSYLNDFSVTRLGNALDVIDADPGAGVDPQCRSAVDGSDPNCVPYNVFTPGGVTQEALGYLQIPLLQRGEATQQQVVGTVTGEFPWGSPAAESNLQAAFGIEYRRDTINQTVDENFATGNAAGQGGPTLPLTGEVDVFEAFTEMRLPLVEGAAFADLISVDFAYRFSSYSTGIETDSYKVGADWAPTEDFRFRGSFQRAVRAANIIELFTSQGFGLFDMDFDPCDAVNRPVAAGPVPAACIGANPWQVSGGQSGSGALNSPAGQYNGLFGGNPTLTPEEADTYTVGFVLTPRFLPGFNLSVDYFSIEVTNLVSTTGALNTLNDCYENGTLSSCQRISRNPANGALWVGTGVVEDLNTNIGGLSTSGYDINASYNWELGDVGSLNFALVGTLLEELITDPGAATGVDPYDCVGGFGSICGTPNPEWRHRLRVSWQTPWNVELFGTWRYFGEVERRNAANAPVTGLLDSNFDAENYFDIAGNWDVYENTRLRFGVNNILDNDPPISNNVGAGFGNGNTFPQVYDSQGRWVFAGITVDF